MKKIKKILAAVMTLAMVLGMSMTSFAAETTEVVVTVNNTEEADLYVDQIVVANTSSTDGWAYDTDYDDFFTDITIGELVAIAKTGENGNASNGTLTTSSDLAAALEALKSTVQNETNKVDGNSFRATAGGLYVVVLEYK